VTSDHSHSHSGGQDHVTKDHVEANRDKHGGQDHVVSRHVTTDHTHKNHVTSAHVISDHAHSGGSTNNATSDNVETGELDHAQRGIPDNMTTTHVAVDHALRSGPDHVTTDHAHKEHATKSPVSSKHVIMPSPETSQPQKPDLSAHVGCTLSEVLMHEFYIFKHLNTS